MLSSLINANTIIDPGFRHQANLNPHLLRSQGHYWLQCRGAASRVVAEEDAGEDGDGKACQRGH